jgi:hypothetical protein
MTTPSIITSPPQTVFSLITWSRYIRGSSVVSTCLAAQEDRSKRDTMSTIILMKLLYVLSVLSILFKGSRVQGFKGSRVQGFKGSRVQGFKVFFGLWNSLFFNL